MVSNEYEDYSDTVLYDVFYEAGTMLGGWLFSLERKARENGDYRTARLYENERLSMSVDRDSVDPFDREAQIAWIKKWDTRRAEIDNNPLAMAM